MNSSTKYVRLSDEEAQELCVLVAVWMNARQAMCVAASNREHPSRMGRLISNEVESAEEIFQLVINAAAKQQNAEDER